MSNNNDGYFVNFEAIIEEIKNRAVNEFFIHFAKDEKESETISKIFRAFNNRGVSSMVVYEALMEAFKEE